MLVLSATAAIVYHEYRQNDIPQEVQTLAPTVTPLEEVKVIDFEEAKLSAVVERIEEVYNVKIGNLPTDADVYTLSLHYEGNPVDLVLTINEILETQLTVSEK